MQATYFVSVLHKLFFCVRIATEALFLEDFDMLNRFDDLNNIVENM